MYSEDFLSLLKGSYLSSEKALAKSNLTSEISIFSLFIPQVLYTKTTYKNYGTLFQEVYKTVYCSD